MDVVIGLGSNVGDRRRTLASAVTELRAELAGLSVSALYETDPIGPPQDDYLNAAVRGLYPGEPSRLLVRLLEVEAAHGRTRRVRWGPRTLDLDILWISGIAVSLPDLVVPHRHLAERRFALMPLLDVAPEATDPATREPLRNWLEKLTAVGVRTVAPSGWESRL